jgi:ABC-type nitrate/sulfonate/bicarbonate transport system permease component
LHEAAAGLSVLVWQLVVDLDLVDRAFLPPPDATVKAAGDGHFITRVEEGKIPRITTIDRVYAYMDGKTKAVRTRSITTIERQR